MALGTSVDLFLTTSLIISVSWLYSCSRVREQSSTRTYIGIVLLLHSIYLLHGLLIAPPPNLFKALGLPINASMDQIRQALVQKAGTDSFPKPLETLLKRLATFDMRAMYVRFGQSILQTCEYCQTYDEYALYALPFPILSYIRETALIGLVTIRGTQRERWRTLGVGTVVLSAILEGYWLSTVIIKIPKRGDPTNNFIMWHDLCYTLRQIVFLVLPIIIHYLPSTLSICPFSTTSPAASPESLSQGLGITMTTLESALTRLHLLKYFHGAILRLHETRENAAKWWEEEHKEGEWIRGDEGVRRIAEREGLGFGPFADEVKGDARQGEQPPDGKLLASAKIVVNSLLKDGFVPSPHWRPH